MLEISLSPPYLRVCKKQNQITEQGARMLKSLDLEDETYRTQYIKPHAAEEITMHELSILQDCIHIISLKSFVNQSYHLSFIFYLTIGYFSLFLLTFTIIELFIEYC